MSRAAYSDGCDESAADGNARDTHERDIDEAIRALDSDELLAYYKQFVDELGEPEKMRFFDKLRRQVAKDCL